MKKLWLWLVLAVLLPALLCACAKTGDVPAGSSPAPDAGSPAAPEADPAPAQTGSQTGEETAPPPAASSSVPADGSYRIAVTLTGGTGRASVASPALLEVREGRMTATLVWSSANYDYMLVDGERYDTEIVDGHSTFVIPVAALDTELPVVGDTVAMSTPHEISYTLNFDSSTLEAVTP